MKGKLILAIILIIIAILIVWKQTKGPTGKVRTYETTLIDTEAGVIYRGKVPLGTTQPYLSPHSGKKTAYFVYYCPECDVYFPYVPPPAPKVKSPEELPPDFGRPECPLCGSKDVEMFRLPKGSSPIKVEKVEGGKAFRRVE